jgi:hypothetical protein
MSPFQRHPRRPFSNQMMCPYFQTQHYKDSHSDMEKKIENRYKKIIALIKRKKR